MRIWHVVAAAALVGAACDDNNISTPANVTPAGPGLVSRTDIVTNRTDPTLINAWGLAFNPLGFAWVSATESGISEVYDSSGRHAIPSVVIPGPGGVTSAPTGQVFNGDGSAFLGDKFIFVTEDGVIAGWSSGTAASVRVDRSNAQALYKGVTIASAGGVPLLYATNFHAGTVEVYDQSYNAIQLGFVDPNLPAGFAPFNIANIDGALIVAYAMQDDMGVDDVKGAGLGYVDRFDPNGVLIARLISAGELNAPWGMTMTPSTFGAAPNRLLVGNFGDGQINIYQLNGNTAVHEGQLKAANGVTMAIDGLWALEFGVNAGGFAADQLYFTAGPLDETEGVFGRLATAPASNVGGGTTGTMTGGGTTTGGTTGSGGTTGGGGTYP